MWVSLGWVSYTEMIGSALKRKIAEQGQALLHAGPGQAPMQGCILKIQVRFCLQHSDSGGGEGMSQLSRRHGPKWREWNINDESIRAELKDSNAAKPTPYHGEWRAMLLLLRNTFLFFFFALVRCWTGAICFTVALADVEKCNTPGYPV